MAKILISGKYGTNNPTLATLPFIAAKTAKQKGHEVVIWLWDEATVLARRGAADPIVGVNLKPLREVLQEVIDLAIPVWACKGCALARGVSPEELLPNAEIKEMADFIEALVAFDKSVQF